ncbi:MAG: SUMF1/EgtB/PvdO family nonheme iron enzyme [Polyangiales bacterium]
MKRDPVTVRAYAGFLNDLLAQGCEAEALAAAPQLPRAAPASQLPPLVRDATGRFAVSQDPRWSPDVPVSCVDWHAARAYARWCAARTGLGWRLPNEYEREKAARGCDGRAWPWGDQGEPTFACLLEGQREAPRLHPVDAFPRTRASTGCAGSRATCATGATTCGCTTAPQ